MFRFGLNPEIMNRKVALCAIILMIAVLIRGCTTTTSQ